MTRSAAPVLISFAGLAIACGSKAGLDSEALTEAKKAWTSALSTCGATFVALTGDETVYAGIRQLSGVQFTAEPRSLTDADRLNGVEWAGRVRIQPAAERVFIYRGAVPANPNPAEFSEWQAKTDNLWDLEAMKQRGGWSISWHPMRGPVRPGPCDKVPPT